MTLRFQPWTGLIPFGAVVWTAAWCQPAASRAVQPFAAVDACALASADDIRPALTVGDLELRAKGTAPRKGEGVCRWEAYERGLIAATPPDFTLVVTVYHQSEDARTATAFVRSWPLAIVPSQVRTDDPADQVARPDADTVAVLHGHSVVVIDAGGQQQDIQRSTDRVYRLEALAFRVVGARVLGPVDLRTTQDACTPLLAQHVLGILTLEPSSLRVDHDGWRCTMQVKDGSLDTSHWTENHGRVVVERQDLGTNAAALRFQKNQAPFLPVSTLVRTSDPSDRLVANIDKPLEMWVVHGANYVDFNVTEPTPAAQAAPGWLYRMQRLALEAAGATVVGTPGNPPDPVVPGPLSTATVTAADGHWTPPAHPAPAWSVLTDPVVSVIAFLAKYRFFAMPLLVIMPAILLAFATSRARRAGRPAKAQGGWIAFFVVVAVANVVGGTWLTTLLVYHAGVSGSATVTASRNTSTQYNNQNVRAHTVLIRGADGGVTATGFSDDDFNVYPPHNATSYPGKGDTFTVRYLPHAPQTFVIVANDDSPWTHGLRCDGLMRDVGEAGSTAHFAPETERYRAAYDAALAAARANHCDVSR